MRGYLSYLLRKNNQSDISGMNSIAEWVLKVNNTLDYKQATVDFQSIFLPAPVGSFVEGIPGCKINRDCLSILILLYDL